MPRQAATLQWLQSLSGYFSEKLSYLETKNKMEKKYLNEIINANWGRFVLRIRIIANAKRHGKRQHWPALMNSFSSGLFSEKLSYLETRKKMEKKYLHEIRIINAKHFEDFY